MLVYMFQLKVRVWFTKAWSYPLDGWFINAPDFCKIFDDFKMKGNISNSIPDAHNILELCHLQRRCSNPTGGYGGASRYGNTTPSVPRHTSANAGNAAVTFGDSHSVGATTGGPRQLPAPEGPARLGDAAHWVAAPVRLVF